MSRSQSAGSYSTNGPTLSHPALLTNTSIRPNCACTCSTMASTDSRDVTSAWMPTPPTASAASLAVCLLTSVTTTVAPSAASFSAIPRPMPCPAPVTIAIFPSNLPIVVSLRRELAAELLSGNDQLHDLRGAVADLQAQYIAQALLDGQRRPCGPGPCQRPWCPCRAPARG